MGKLYIPHTQQVVDTNHLQVGIVTPTGGQFVARLFPLSTSVSGASFDLSAPVATSNEAAGILAAACSAMGWVKGTTNGRWFNPANVSYVRFDSGDVEIESVDGYTDVADAPIYLP